MTNDNAVPHSGDAPEPEVIPRPDWPENRCPECGRDGLRGNVRDAGTPECATCDAVWALVDVLDRGPRAGRSHMEDVRLARHLWLSGLRVAAQREALVISPQDIAAARRAWIDECCDAKGINANEWFAAFLNARMRKDG